MRRGSGDWLGFAVGVAVAAFAFSVWGLATHRWRTETRAEPSHPAPPPPLTAIPQSAEGVDTNRVPTAAHDVEDLKNGWVIFTLDGHRFLYRKLDGQYNNQSQALVYLDEDTEEHDRLQRKGQQR